MVLPISQMKKKFEDKMGKIQKSLRVEKVLKIASYESCVEVQSFQSYKPNELTVLSTLPSSKLTCIANKLQKLLALNFSLWFSRKYQQTSVN
jgi:hypothetical protein